MAREEEDREDLLREATALVERVELAIEGIPEHVVIGFRREGQASVFFGADPAWHFNSRNELRRAYVNGRLLKAERGYLVSLTRQRSEREIALLRHELDEQETAALLDALLVRLHGLQSAINDGRARNMGQIPVAADVEGRVRAWLTELTRPITIAQAAQVS